MSRGGERDDLTPHTHARTLFDSKALRSTVTSSKSHYRLHVARLLLEAGLPKDLLELRRQLLDGCMGLLTKRWLLEESLEPWQNEVRQDFAREVLGP